MGSEVTWVTLIQNLQDNPKLVFDASNIPVGEYQVTFESYDANSTV